MGGWLRRRREDGEAPGVSPDSPQTHAAVETTRAPQKVRFQEAGIEGALAGISRDLADRLADYGARASTDGDIAAAMWLRQMTRDIADRTIGILRLDHPELADRFAGLEAYYRNMTAIEYYHTINMLFHEALRHIGMVGKASRPVSHDTGEGLGFLASPKGDVEPESG